MHRILRGLLLRDTPPNGAFVLLAVAALLHGGLLPAGLVPGALRAGGPLAGRAAGPGDPGGVVSFFTPRPAYAQAVARVSVDRENFRKEPGADGTILATVRRGTELPILDRSGRWRRVWLRGWVWAPSVEATTREGADLVVTADGGENLRDVPNGRIAARMREGMLLYRTGEQVENWYQVEREGWIWAPSVTIRGETSAQGAAGMGDAAGEEGGEARTPSPTGSPAGARSAGDTGAPSARERLVVRGGGESAGAAGPGATGGGDGAGAGDVGASLLTTPDGDTVAVARPGSGVEVMDRRGEWVRVRVDGWVRAPALVDPDSAEVIRDLTVAELREEPEEYRGRRVRWTVRFVSLERAEATRTDFYEGEPYVLARPAEGEGVVYLAVTPELLPRVEELEPLQAIEVLARVRTGSSSLTGVPILELLAIY